MGSQKIDFVSDKLNMLYLYLHHFAWHVEQDWDHRWVIIAVDDKTHLLQPGPEVAGVCCQLADPSDAWKMSSSETQPDVDEWGNDE